MIVDNGFKIAVNRIAKNTPDYTPDSTFKVGENQSDISIIANDIDNPLPIQNLQNVYDGSTTINWISTDTFELTSDHYKTNSSALSLAKSSSSASAYWYNPSLTTYNFDKDNYLLGWIYIDSQTILDKLADTNTIQLRYGSDYNTNYYYRTYDKTDLQVGWNLLKFTPYNQYIGDWTELQPVGATNNNWSIFSIYKPNSVDTKIIVGSDTINGRLYLTSDYINWTEIRPLNINTNKRWNYYSYNFYTGVLSAYGNRLYYTPDWDNWYETQPAGDVDKNWKFIDIHSADKVAIAGVMGGRLYLSSGTTIHTDGFNWSEIQPKGNVDGNWNIVKIDNTGNILIAEYPGRIYLRKEYDGTISEIQPKGNVDGNWSSLFISSVYSSSSLIIVTEYGGRIYKSIDNGNTWVELQPKGNVDANWVAIDSLYSGYSGAEYRGVIVASTDTRSYISYDYGNNWVEIQPAGDVDKDFKLTQLMWNSIDDKYSLTLGDYGGGLYKTNLYDNSSDPDVSGVVGYPNATTNDTLTIYTNFTTSTDTLTKNDLVIDDYNISNINSSYLKNFEIGYPQVDEYNMEILKECKLTVDDANGYLIDSIGTFNTDSSVLMSDIFKFTAISKSSDEEIIFDIKNRLKRR